MSSLRLRCHLEDGANLFAASKGFHAVGFVLQRPDLVQSFVTKIGNVTPRISRAKEEGRR